jgi:16S rRNA (guanine966-N2)-methyltransferase
MPEAGRVIAGTAGGRRLLAPGPGTRPLADRVKQTLFAILEPDLEGAAFLDLFAGSGAAGIEALSRGAARATFVERDADAVRIIRENLRRTGLEARANLVAADVGPWLAYAGVLPGAPRPTGRLEPIEPIGPFDVVFMDPPYAEVALLATTLERLADPAAARLTANARVVAKHFWRDEPPERVGLLEVERTRRFGETSLTFYRSTGNAGSEGA